MSIKRYNGKDKCRQVKPMLKPKPIKPKTYSLIVKSIMCLIEVLSLSNKIDNIMKSLLYVKKYNDILKKQIIKYRIKTVTIFFIQLYEVLDP